MNNSLILEIMTIEAKEEKIDSQLVDLVILYGHKLNHF